MYGSMDGWAVTSKRKSHSLRQIVYKIFLSLMCEFSKQEKNS